MKHQQTPSSSPRTDRRNPESVASRQIVTDALMMCRAALENELPALGTPMSADASLESLRTAVTQFAQSASRQRVPPERLLAMLKGMMFRLAEMERRSASERDEITRRLVLIAIEAYYPDGSSTAD